MDAPSSWLGILLILALVTVAIVFVIRANSSPTNESFAISREERLRRREHLRAAAAKRVEALQKTDGGDKNEGMKDQQTVAVRRRRRRDREANAQDEAASNDDINHFVDNNDVDEELAVDTKADKMEGDEDQTTAEHDTGYRDRHAEAIAKIMAKRTHENYTQETWDAEDKEAWEQLLGHKWTSRPLRGGELISVAQRAVITAKINATSGESIYHRAAMQGNLNLLRKTVDAGHSWVLKIGDVNGWTPLHEAVRAGRVDVVDFLVQMAEMDIEQETRDGSTPLSLALRYHGMRHPVTKMLQTFVQCGGTDLFS